VTAFRKSSASVASALQVVALEASDYQQALRQRLAEGAQEVAKASEEDLVTELADLLGVMEAAFGP
jgi:hypothetical protein